MFDRYFYNTSCVITGAASGIGFALAELLFKSGANVFMADLNEDSLKNAKKLLLGQGRLYIQKTDVTNVRQVERLIRKADEKFEGLDFVFNNAGVGATKPFEDITQTELEHVIKLDLLSVIYGSRAAINIMLKRKSGHIINTSSIAGIIPFAYQSIYCAAKFAVRGFTEALRYEYADSGIQFTTICPGNVATPIFGTSIDGKHYDIPPPKDSISPADAAMRILNTVKDGGGIAVFPESVASMCEMYSTGTLDKQLYDMAKKRSESIKKEGCYY